MEHISIICYIFYHLFIVFDAYNDAYNFDNKIVTIGKKFFYYKIVDAQSPIAFLIEKRKRKKRCNRLGRLRMNVFSQLF